MRAHAKTLGNFDFLMPFQTTDHDNVLGGSALGHSPHTDMRPLEIPGNFALVMKTLPNPIFLRPVLRCQRSSQPWLVLSLIGKRKKKGTLRLCFIRLNQNREFQEEKKLNP